MKHGDILEIRNCDGHLVRYRYWTEWQAEPGTRPKPPAELSVSSGVDVMPCVNSAIAMINVI